MTRNNQHKVQTHTKVPFDVSDFHSLDLLFDLTKERVTVQIDQVDKLDTKASSTVASATALISAALTIQAVLPALLQSHPQVALKTIMTLIPLILLALTYFVTTIFCLLAYKIRAYNLTPDPVGLYNYLYEEESVTKAYVMRSMISDYQKNEKEIDRKVTWNKVAFISLLCETVFFITFLFFHAIR